MKNKKMVLLSIFLLVIILLGGTLAFIVWESDDEQKTNVVFTINGSFSCSADGGGNITSNDVMLAPTSCTNDTYAIQREVVVTSKMFSSWMDIEMDLWLNVDNITEGLSNSENFRYALTTEKNSCTTGVVSSGNFKNLKNGGKVDLLNQKVFSSSKSEKYYLYVWLDTAETSASTMDQQFKLSLGGSCAEVLKVEKPVLDNGMIPVTISDTGVVTTVSKDDRSWYDYENQRWANAVLLRENKVGSGVVSDLSGNRKDGTFVSAPTYSAEGLVLDGNDDGISLGSQLKDLFKNSNTIQMKVKRDQTGVRDIFIGNYNASNSVAYEATAANAYRTYLNAGSLDVSVGTVSYNEYILYTFVFDKANNTINIYEDSTLVGTVNDSKIGSYSYNYTAAYIGRDSRTGATSLKGTIERVMIYGDVLSEEEIVQNIDTEYGEIGTETGVVADNLLLYYDFRNPNIREYHLNNVGSEIAEADILAYYTWIPRYKYKIWTTEVSANGKEQPIDVVFEGRNAPISLGTKVDEYRTHPAFLWDDDNDGIVTDDEILPGIWVGKFETTGNTTTPTVKPNQASIVKTTASAQFTASLKFAGGTFNTTTGEVTFTGSSTYGLTDKMDSHMMKNSEWGAVAYLSHSKYGINEQIRINNYFASSKTLTGCGAATANEATKTTCGIPYNTPSSEEYTYPQSTTGNVTGVFDMAGGAWDVLMTNYNDVKASSGFSKFPSSKYYDKYTTTDVLTACGGTLCYGHALSETSGWYGDRFDALSTSNTWIYRGGSNGQTTTAGSYSLAAAAGGSGDAWGARSVLIPKLTKYTVEFNTTGGIVNDSNFFVETDETILYTASGENEYIVPSNGHYKLEVWGAQGGKGMVDGTAKYDGGYGGYSVGTIYLTEGTNLYTYVGGTGGNAGNKQAGGTAGYNGGGVGGSDSNYSSSGGNEPGAGGGGATHIATINGELSTFDLDTNLDKILIVAGGGGGSAYYGSGGHGGGIVGNYGTESTTAAGTQNSGNAVGLGGDGGSFTGGSGGGGGGYYGGYGGVANGVSGAGGSGYIGNELLMNKAMYCYDCTTSDDVDTLTFTNTSVSANPIANNSKSGAGAAKISLLSIEKIVFNNEIYGEFPVPTREGYGFLGWYTAPDGGEKVTDDMIYSLESDQTLYAHWEPNKLNISYSVNGGVLTSSTTDGTNTYNWTTQDGLIYLNGQKLTSVVNNGDIIDLIDTNNSSYLNVTSKNGYGIITNKEWKCLSGCKNNNLTFNQSLTYEYEDFCSGGNCDIVLGVNTAKMYTVSYDANTGSGAPASQIKYHGEPLILSDVVPTKDGYVFLGWSTKANDTIPSYKKSDEFNINNNVTLYAIWANEFVVTLDANEGAISTVTYTEAKEHTFVVPETAKYKLEVWGGQGGTVSNTSSTSYGGYSVGEIDLNINQQLFVNVGGKGSSNCKTSTNYVVATCNGGYNGGGVGKTQDAVGPVGGGGGATHIAMESGTLASLNSYEELCNSYSAECPIMIVAGGGGGSGYWNYTSTKYGYGGAGGGFQGVTGKVNSTNNAAGGTQTTGAGFGQGGSAGSLTNLTLLAGGGGGYYGGKAGVSNFAGGGGGSGYIGHPSLTNKAMYCYNCSTSSDANTLTYSTTKYSSGTIEKNAKTGVGAARISQITDSTTVFYGLTYGELPVPVRDGYDFVGWNTESDGSGEYINSDTVVDIFGDQTLYAIWALGAQYLYKNGDTYSAITGGWVGNNAGGDGQGVCSCKPSIWTAYDYNGTSALRFYTYNINNFGKSVARTANKIDLTNYSKLVFVQIHSQAGSGSSAAGWSSGWNESTVGVLNSGGGSCSSVSFAKSVAGQSVGTKTIDISSLSGSYYIGSFMMSSGTDIITAYSQIYLVP